MLFRSTLGIVTRTGSVASIGGSVITGVTTTSLQIGDTITYFGNNVAYIYAVGINSVTAYAPGFNTTGSQSFTFTRPIQFSFINLGFTTDLSISDPLMGQINADVLNANNTTISNLVVTNPVATITITNENVTTSNVTNSFVGFQSVGVQTVTSENVSFSNIGVSSIGVGILTYAGISTVAITSSYTFTGFATNFTVTNLGVVTGTTYTFTLSNLTGTFNEIGRAHV